MGDVEEVVARDSQVDSLGALRVAAVLHHALEVGVHLGLRRVGRLGPAMHGGLDALHGEVGALDDAQLDGRASAATALDRPGGERALHPVRLGQIRLEHDTRPERDELLLVEHLAKGRHRQVEVAMLLHVEVDELRRQVAVGVAVAMAQGLLVEDAQPRLHALHGVTEGHQVDLAEDGGHLHRDVLHVLAGEEGEIGFEPTRRFTLSQDRLAEQVEVQAHTRATALGQVALELLLLARQDQRLGLVTQAGHDRGHHHARQVVAHDPAEHEGHSLPPLHEVWSAVAMEQIAELVGDPLGPATAEGLIDEGDGELFAARILHHAGEAARLRYLGRCLLARASRSSVAASSTARPARSLRRVIADMAPIAWPAWIEMLRPRPRGAPQRRK